MADQDTRKQGATRKSRRDEDVTVTVRGRTGPQDSGGQKSEAVPAPPAGQTAVEPAARGVPAQSGRDEADQFRLKDLKIGEKDKRGKLVQDILWAVPEFKIYRTEAGINPHFSDIEDEAMAQRRRYLGVGEHLSSVNHVLMSVPVRQPYFEREVARAIAQTLSGQEAAGIKTLQAIRNRAATWRAAYGRITYIVVCLIVAAVLVGTYGAYAGMTAGTPSQLWLAMACGSVGALLSVSTKLRILETDVDSAFVMAYVSGMIRMLIGMIAAVVVYLAVKGGFFATFFSALGGVLSQGEMNEPGSYQIAFLSILAGFSERLVPDVLERKAQEMGRKQGDDSSNPSGTESS